jgi:hypothetical protein
MPVCALAIYLADEFPNYRIFFAIFAIVVISVSCLHGTIKDLKEEAIEKKRIAELEKFWKEHHPTS